MPWMQNEEFMRILEFNKSSETYIFGTVRMFAIWGWVKTLVPLVNIKIAGKWMFIPLKMVLIGIDP